MAPTELEKENLGIGARVRDARIARGLSQDKLAEFADTIPSVIEKLENGEVLLPLIVVEIATVLGVTPAWLIWGNPYAPMRVIIVRLWNSQNRFGITRRS